MSQATAIEWTESTWNPVTGCDRVSPGCDHCYAQALARRLKAMGSPRYQKDGSRKTSGPGFGVSLHPDKLAEPFTWRRPRTVFVNSMSDLFHNEVTDEFIAQVFAVMSAAADHRFQVLTKRPRRMVTLLQRASFLKAVQAAAMNWTGDNVEWPLPNVWLGISVENQKWADQRIPLLIETPATVRFLSCEPLLGPLDLDRHLLGSHQQSIDRHVQLAEQARQLIHWVIVGGESGPNSRPIRSDWVRSLRDQCVGAGVPFFFKQWGGRTPKAGGRHLDRRTWDELPQSSSVDSSTPNSRAS